MTKTKIRWVAFLSILAISSIVLAQGYWVYQLWSFNEKQFSQRVKITLAKVANQLLELHGSVAPRTKFINQVTSNYFVVNINDNINIEELEYFLIKEFQANHINESFEYGIYDCGDNQMVYGNFIHINTENLFRPKGAKIQSNLPLIEGLTYYFGVLFPDKNVGMITDMRVALMLSLLLVGAILVYLYALWVIIRQNELSELQKDFINNMTHEFKTPLSNIKLATSAIQSDPYVSSSKRLYGLGNIINQQNLRLINHVEKILQLARMERDNFVLEKEPIDLKEMINELVTSFQLLLDKNGGQIILNLPEESVILVADKVHMANILDNLVDNAIKYSPEEPAITITLSKNNNTVKLIIEDKGIGMDLPTQKKVFGKFYRHPTGNVHDVKGFGLGLYYVQNVCRAHHWKLNIESEVNLGTKIIITIPNK